MDLNDDNQPVRQAMEWTMRMAPCLKSIGLDGKQEMIRLESEM